jgi:hypothetical protein
MKTHLPLVALILLTLSPLLASAAADSHCLAHCYGMHTDTTTQSQYCLSSDGEKTEKQKTVQFITTAPGREKNIVSQTSTITLRTGSSKTVGQTLELLTGVFQKFLANPAPGTVLGKLGNLEKGGEVDFVAASPDVLRLDFKSATGVSSSEFTKADVQNYLALLTNG